jgi:hypothetical protein
MGCIKDYEEPQNAKSPETRLSTCKYWPECGRVPGINPPASHALAEHTKLARSAKISMTAIDRFLFYERFKKKKGLKSKRHGLNCES